MNWRSEWTAVAARIDGVVSAADFFVRTLAINSGDSYNVTDKHLGKEAREILTSLRTFLAAHGGAIPPEAAAAWAATIILSGIATIILAGGEESKAA
jgi:hypothetical protein